jgi:hypothetical protein
MATIEKFDFCGSFLHIVEENPAVLQSIWFRDELCFHLKGYGNK